MSKYKSSITGRFVKEEYAKNNKATTYKLGDKPKEKTPIKKKR